MILIAIWKIPTILTPRHYVEQELGYTRSILDPLPGRDKIKPGSTQLLAIGTVGAPQMGGQYYFYTRREGNQNQPVLYVRDGLNGEDRPLCRRQQTGSRRHHRARLVVRLAKTANTSPTAPRRAARKRARSTSLKLPPAKLLPDTIDRTRFASLAWKKDNSGFYYTRHPQKGDVPAGEEVYHVKVFYHQLGSDPAKDPLIFGEGRNPQDIPRRQSFRRWTAGC